jgi:stalled ribosome alternative rescue factor ArfA
MTAEVEALEKARQQLLKARHELAAKLGGNYQRAQTEDWRAEFRDVQATIDAIDRALVEAKGDQKQNVIDR